jgi:hypothetical protein
MSPKRRHADDLRGASRLVIEATEGVTAAVEAMHHAIASGPAVLGSPLAGGSRLVTGLVYGSIRGVAGLVGRGLDEALARLGPHLGASAPGPERDALLAVVNGVVGDHLEATGNPLAIPMRLRRDGAPLTLTPAALRAAVPDAGPRLVVLVHGSCANDRQWQRRGHDHGAALGRDLGATPIYVHYNSGRHVSTGGHELAALLDELVAAWPVPGAELVLLGHSMGGLVARSACHAGAAAGHRWPAHLRALACLGTPHHGAPLERGGAWAHELLGVSRYSAPLARLARLRSAGVTDLRHGNVLDADWAGADRFADHADRRVPAPLPEGVACYAIAGTTAADVDGDGRLPGDGMVPVDSALGRHRSPARTLAFPADHQWISPATGHLDLLSAPAVYQRLRAWLA